VAVGNENNLTLAVYGTKGSIRWSQENPNNLWFSKLGAAPQMFTRGGGSSYPSAAAVTRIPAGHPEGYLEAFATLYREAAEVIIASGKTTQQSAVIGIEQGFEGVRFVDACQRSSKAHAAWVTL
jgi:predicted dehydrogenase